MNGPTTTAPGDVAPWRAGRRSVLSGAIILGVVVVLTLIAMSQLVGADAYAISDEALLPPSAEHPFGTDDIGRDVWSGIVLGAPASLLIGILASGLATVLGLLIGGAAGLTGGWVDEVLMRIAEVFQSMPRLFLLIVVVALMGADVWLIILLIALSYWPASARLVRGQMLALRSADFVTAAGALGCRPSRIMLRHMVPSTLAPIAAHAALQAGGAVLAEAGRSFLGVGDSSMVSWGGMLTEAHHFMRDAWWIGTFPGLAIALTVLGWSLLADGLTAPRR